MADMHEIDYKVYGDDLQFVEVELDPQEAVVAEAARYAAERHQFGQPIPVGFFQDGDGIAVPGRRFPGGVAAARQSLAQRSAGVQTFVPRAKLRTVLVVNGLVFHIQYASSVRRARWGFGWASTTT